MKKIYFLLSAALMTVCSLTFTACGDDDEVTPTPTPEVTTNSVFVEPCLAWGSSRDAVKDLLISQGFKYLGSDTDIDTDGAEYDVDIYGPKLREKQTEYYFLGGKLDQVFVVVAGELGLFEDLFTDMLNFSELDLNQSEAEELDFYFYNNDASVCANLYFSEGETLEDCEWIIQFYPVPATAKAAGEPVPAKSFKAHPKKLRR